MATTSIKQLESFDSGSNYNFQEKMLDPKAARSVFDLSHKLSGTMSELGTIYPIEIIPTIMGDSYDISVNTLLRALPSVVPLVSRQRLYIYAFYGRMGDYWNNFETFMKKGYSGNVIKKLPVITKDKNIATNNAGNSTTLEMWNTLTYNSTWETTKSIQAESMGECMGLPWNYTIESHGSPSVTGLANKSNFTRFVKNGISTEETEISAIPFMMMLRIWRDYFTNKNYHINDRVLLPDDDAEFRLNDDGELISAKNNNIKLEFDISSRKRGIFYHEAGSTTEYTEYDTNQNIDILHVGLPTHEYPKDRWTSALPFLQRGDAPSLEYKLSSDILRVHPYPQEGSTLDPSTFEDINLYLPAGSYTNTTNAVWAKNGSTFSSPGTDGGIRLNENTVKIDIKMSDIRALAIEQTELEKMARTDGSYREFGLTFFGVVSKNATDHKPVYIGGSYQEINYTEVVQTSETNNTPMGSYTGHSTEVLSGNLGHIDCDDYGYIMILACIMPDVLYSEGLEDHWTNLYQSQMYLPERARIGMTNLLNKSIRFDYDDSTSATDYNEGLFAYQNYGDEYRYLPNRVKGHLAEGWNKSFFPYTQSRVLGGNVNWGREFAIADKDNVRRDYLQAPDEPAFTYDMKLDIRAVRPIPYKPVPANLTGLA